MDTHILLKQGRAIWGDEKYTLSEIIVRLGVDVGDLCRMERGAEKDASLQTPEELQKQLGNMLFSLIRWCDDLGFDPDTCLHAAIESQQAFVAKNRTR